MKKTLYIAALAASMVAAAGSANATAVYTQSFETTPPLASGVIQYGAAPADGYDTNSSGAVVVPGVTFTGFSGVVSNANLVFAPTSFGTQAGFVQAYNGAGAQIDLAVSGLTEGQAFELEFYDEATPVASAATFSVSGLGIATTNFTPSSFAYTPNVLDFTANAVSGTLSFAVPAASGNFATAIDEVSIVAVPEPATWAMMLAGFAMIGFAVRQRRSVAIAM